MRWSVLSSRVLYEGRPHRLRLDTCRTPKGVEVKDYFVREVNDIAMVFALTVGEEVVLVRQYRHGAGEVTLELPQGLLEAGEGAREGGLRELLEETGFAPARMEQVGELWASPAVQPSRVHLLVGYGAARVAAPAPEPEEELEVRLVPVGELEGLIDGGELKAAGSVAGALLGLRHLARARR